MGQGDHLRERQRPVTPEVPELEPKRRSPSSPCKHAPHSGLGLSVSTFSLPVPPKQQPPAPLSFRQRGGTERQVGNAIPLPPPPPLAATCHSLNLVQRAWGFWNRVKPRARWHLSRATSAAAAGGAAMRPAQSPQNNLGLERRPGSPGRGPTASTTHSITGAVKCIVSGVHNLTIRGSEAQKTFIWDMGS